MGVEENKALVHRLYELYNQHDLDATVELYSPDWHAGPFTLEQNKKYDVILHNAFPDLTCTILDMVAEGDEVAYIVNGKGTHTGAPYMGAQPEGKKIEMTNTWIVTIVDNKIVEHKGTGDFVTPLQQLGVIPPIQVFPEEILA